MKAKFAGALALTCAALALVACGGGGGGSSTVDTAAFCDAANSIQSLSSSSQLAPGDLDGLKKLMQQLTDDVQKADANAPAEVKSDVDTASAAITKANDAIQGANSVSDIQALAPQIQQLQTTLSGLGNDVDTYVKDNC